MSAFGYGSALDRAENADAQLSRKALVFWTVFDVLVGVIGIQALTGQLGVGGVSSWIVAAASGALLLGSGFVVRAWKRRRDIAHAGAASQRGALAEDERSRWGGA